MMNFPLGMIFFQLDYEKLTYEFLQRKIAHEKLKEAHEELENLNLSLLVQQESRKNNESVSPCLTCLEREKTELSTESSKGKETIIIDDANPSVEQNPSATE